MQISVRPPANGLLVLKRFTAPKNTMLLTFCIEICQMQFWTQPYSQAFIIYIKPAMLKHLGKQFLVMVQLLYVVHLQNLISKWPVKNGVVCTCAYSGMLFVFDVLPSYVFYFIKAAWLIIIYPSTFQL